MRRLVLTAVLLVPALATPAAAQGALWIVSRTSCPDADFMEIQDAVDVAADGDTILVRAETLAIVPSYSPFTVDGKSLSVVASSPVGIERVFVDGVTVRNVPAGGTVLLRGLLETNELLVEDNLGLVVVEGCGFGGPSPGMARVEDSSAVVFTRCTFRPEPAVCGFVPPICSGQDGPDALTILGSAVELFACTVIGGEGQQLLGVGSTGGDGGTGVVLASSSLLISGSSVTGGMGGTADLVSTGGDGGTGIELDAASTARAVGSTFDAGTPAPGGGSGADIVEAVGGSLTTERGPVRDIRFHDRDPIRESKDPVVIVRGASGDLVVAALDIGAGTGAVPIGLPSLHFRPTTFAPLGIVPASGRMRASLRLTGDLVHPQEGIGLIAQGIFTDGFGSFVGSTAATLIVDRGHDVSDGCLDAVALWVDDDAAGDPGPGNPTLSDPLEDGSPQHPFDSIQEALQTATPGVTMTIWVEAGVYDGPGNENIDFMNRTTTVRSVSGPAVTAVSVGSGYAFRFMEFEPATAGLHGLTITGADATAVIITGNATPTIEECVLTGNSGVLGGGAFMDSAGLFRDCTLSDNSASDGGGAFASSGRFEDCAIEDNVASGGGGGVAGDPAVFNDVRVIRCSLTGNAAATFGGGVMGGPGDYRVEDSTIMGNTCATDGGGVARCFLVRSSMIAGNAITFGSGAGIYDAAQIHSSMVIFNQVSPFGVGGGVVCPDTCVVVGSTIADNAGPGLLLDGASSSASLVLDHSIVWGNTGAQVDVTSPNPVVLSIGHSDVEGGAANATVGGLASLALGAGNIDLDPLFSGGLGDYHLTAGSPCIDAGDPGFSDTGFDAFDVDGEARVKGAAVDLGADEL